jgi:hypothetical protein
MQALQWHGRDFLSPLWRDPSNPYAWVAAWIFGLFRLQRIWQSEVPFLRQWQMHLAMPAVQWNGMD